MTIFTVKIAWESYFFFKLDFETIFSELKKTWRNKIKLCRMLVFLKEKYKYIWYIHIYENFFLRKREENLRYFFKKLRKCIQYVQWSTIKLDFAFVDLVLLLLFKSLFLLYDSKKKVKLQRTSRHYIISLCSILSE